MIHDQNLQTFLWAKASRTVVYIQNQSPHKILENMTLEEAFTGIKPEVSHLRIFGSLVYIHLPKDKRSKLEPSGKKGIFVGYSESSKAYRIYIPRQKQIEISGDVSFEEEGAFKRSKGSSMDNEEQETPLDMDIYPDHSPKIQREPTKPEKIFYSTDPIEPTNGPSNISSGRNRPMWARQTMQEAENYAAPRGTFRESKRPQQFSECGIYESYH